MADAREYRFRVELFDELAGMARPYVLTLFKYPSGDNEVAIFDVTKGRQFLRKTQYEALQLEDLHIGAQVTVFARQFKVVGYADPTTRELFKEHKGLVTCVAPADAYKDFGHLLTAAHRAGFVVTKLKTLAAADAAPGISLAIELVGELDGATSQDELRDAVFRGASDVRGVQLRRSCAETDALFSGTSTTATFDNCSLLLVKPHAVREGKAGPIISRLVDANFEVSAMQMFTLTRKEAENFAEVYKGVVEPSAFSNMTQQLCSGPVIAVEVRAENCVNLLRQFAGPFDVEVAKALRPNTLRAEFGKNKTENAVHCTDLDEDGELESQFFFDIMVNANAAAAAAPQHAGLNSHK